MHRFHVLEFQEPIEAEPERWLVSRHRDALCLLSAHRETGYRPMWTSSMVSRSRKNWKSANQRSRMPRM